MKVKAQSTTDFIPTAKQAVNLFQMKGVKIKAFFNPATPLLISAAYGHLHNIADAINANFKNAETCISSCYGPSNKYGHQLTVRVAR